MRRVKVATQEGYSVYIGCGIIDQLPRLLQEHNVSNKVKLVCITDKNTEKLYFQKLRHILSEKYNVKNITIPAGESTKNIATVETIIGQCLQYELDRQSLILSVGGGVIGDIAGFVAATYMRGIRYIHIPTTVIAHDSSIGGKVGINHKCGKNMIGAFYHPLFVLFDVFFLQTLPKEERISGYAEMIKHALIQDQGFVSWLKEHRDELLSLQLEKVEEAIYRSCTIKGRIVSCDEREKGLRMILNYGHTIGHALEAATKYNQYKHGEAVAIGMLGAAYISEAFYGNYVTQETIELLQLFGLPTKFTSSYSDDELVAIMKHDKKTNEEKHRLILLPEIGRAEVVQIEEEFITRALQKIRG